MRRDIKAMCGSVDFVYFIHAPEIRAVKIGTSYDPERRFNQIKNASPVDVYLIGRMLGGLAEEAQLHKRFGASRIRREWFQESDELMEFIGAANDAYEKWYLGERRSIKASAAAFQLMRGSHGQPS